MGLAATIAVAACLYTPFNTDDYLFLLYERAPKFDNSGFFGKKDAEAAQRRGMGIKEYVIEGIDPEYRKIFARAAQIMELYGFEPTINSGFRDDYRQSLASDRGKAAIGYSFHGGSHRGGWGHGLAIDVVSVNAISPVQDERLAASRPMWNWIDRYGPRLGIGRAYGDVDNPHVTPTSSREYAAHHGEHRRTATHHHRRKHIRVAHR